MDPLANLSLPRNGPSGLGAIAPSRRLRGFLWRFEHRAAILFGACESNRQTGAGRELAWASTATTPDSCLHARQAGVDYSRTLMIGRQGLHLPPDRLARAMANFACPAASRRQRGCSRKPGGSPNPSSACSRHGPGRVPGRLGLRGRHGSARPERPRPGAAQGAVHSRSRRGQPGARLQLPVGA